jgi:hypothetical protein
MVKKAVWLLILICLYASGFRPTQAQSNEKKFEVGGQFSVLRVPTRTISSSTFVITEGRGTDYGFGGRFGYNFSKYFTLEAEGNFLPRDRELNGGQKVQGLFGAKVGDRYKKFGFFGKVRPGFVRFEKGDYRFVGGVAVFPPPLANFKPVARTNFAIDLGGVVELYPSKRTIIRFDAGDTIVRLPARNAAAFQVNSPGPAFNVVVLPAAAQTKHNFQGSAGVGFRF